MDGLLKVTPEELEKTADLFSTKGKEIAATTENMMNIVKNINAVWEGEASRAYINTFQGLQDDMLSINNKIQSHASKLTEIANNYKQAENQNTESNSALPNNPLGE